MKKLISMLVMLMIVTLSNAHTLTRKCYTVSSHTYGISATLGASNGTIIVTVYTNSNMSGTPYQAARTFTLNSNGSVDFTVNQPTVSTTMYVKVQWYLSNGSPDNFQNNGDDDNSTSNISIVTTDNTQCQVLAFTFKTVSCVRLSSNTYKLYFEVDDESTIDHYIVRVSNDGTHWKEKMLIFTDSAFTKGIYQITLKF